MTILVHKSNEKLDFEGNFELTDDIPSTVSWTLLEPYFQIRKWSNHQTIAEF